jgi:hypothetical protein
MSYRPRMDGRRSNGWREQVHRIRCGNGQQGLQRASGAPVINTGRPRTLSSTNGSLEPRSRGLVAGLIRGSGLEGQVTTAAPVRFSGAGHQEDHRESAVDTWRCDVGNGVHSSATEDGAGFRTFAEAWHELVRRLDLRSGGGAPCSTGVDAQRLGLWCRTGVPKAGASAPRWHPESEPGTTSVGPKSRCSSTHCTLRATELEPCRRQTAAGAS